MKTDEIRDTFLEFFNRNGHKILPSSSLIPQDDPTLLFTNAGMVQFKKYFLGEIEPEYKNVATVQRCIRAGGKHNDLENVGKTTRHMTFFEMLGNFSFGGYFKREAIIMAWELVTEVFKIPKEKLIATVYQEDDEAEKIWRSETDVKDVIRLGKDSNFWTMGVEGPAGPCSEILFDRGEDFLKVQPHKCEGVECDCDRYLEIWNLVFMEYNLKKNGELEPLTTKNIDTGMGLERVASVLQGVPSVFDIDIFKPLRDTLFSMIPSMCEDIVTTRIILDAARASAFAIADGIMPSNESRGYVIRRIIRRALRYSINHTDSPFLHKIAQEVVISMGNFWKHLKDKVEVISKSIRIEEEKFFETLSRVLPLFEREAEDIKKAGSEKIPGDIVFMFWDTHGLPPDIMKEVAEEKGLKIDEEGFERLRDESRRKAGAKKEEKEREKRIVSELVVLSKNGGTAFVGYETLKSRSKVLAMYDVDGNEAKRAGEGERIFLIVGETPFYPEGGGQVGDRGKLYWAEGEGQVKDTKKVDNFIIHDVEIKNGYLSVGQEVELEVSREWREQSARHHTTTHLLHSALRKILGTHVRQMGSLVEPKRLRFDFSHPVQLSGSELSDIESLINEWIMADFEVGHEIMRLEEALKQGALAFFGDKYGKVVRVVRIGDISLELCGGTHLRETGEAGTLKIVKESSVASGIRRIEAVAGWEIINYLREKEKYMEEIAKILKVSPQDVIPKIKSLIEERERIESELVNLRLKLLMKESNPIIKDVGGWKLIFDYIEGFEKNELGKLLDNLRERFPKSFVLIVGENKGKIYIIGGTNQLDIDSAEVVKNIAKFLGGSGGGKKDFAEGGGKIKKSKNEILSELEKILNIKIK